MLTPRKSEVRLAKAKNYRRKPAALNYRTSNILRVAANAPAVMIEIHAAGKMMGVENRFMPARRFELVLQQRGDFLVQV